MSASVSCHAASFVRMPACSIAASTGTSGASIVSKSVVMPFFAKISCALGNAR